MRRADGDLRRIFRERLTPLGFVLTPIETGGTAAGVPDTYWTHAAARAHGWIEHKSTDGWAVKFETMQLGFLRRATAAGARTAVAVRCRGVGSGGAAGDALRLYSGAAADALADAGIRGAGEPLLYQEGSPRSWDWGAVVRLLTA